MRAKTGRYWHVIRHYKYFFLALAVSAVALIFHLSGKQHIANVLLIGVIVIELIPLLWGMLRDLREGNYGVDLLAAIAIITSLVMGEYWAGVVIVLMLTGGRRQPGADQR
jgi:cation transport ATPase